jgi:hypothetical protein
MESRVGSKNVAAIIRILYSEIYKRVVLSKDVTHYGLQSDILRTSYLDGIPILYTRTRWAALWFEHWEPSLSLVKILYLCKFRPPSERVQKGI